MSIPRPEYPRPQFERNEWMNLNGPWTYRFDHGRSGLPIGAGNRGGDDYGRGFAASTGFDDEIMVPFCPESELSGVGHKDFIETMWYHRQLDIPASWTGRVLLNFGAVDFECDVFIDGTLVDRHAGGQVGFEVDLSRHIKPGDSHNLVLCVQDYLRDGVQPAGKQCTRYRSRGCHYTRTTGIWQTVWLEHAGVAGLKGVWMIPDLDGSALTVIPTYHQIAAGNTLRVSVLAEGSEVASVVATQVDGIPIHVSIPDVRAWSPVDPFLYGIRFDVIDATGTVVDTVASYTGIRKVHVEGGRVYLNNEPLFQRLVLDQGFYPDGIWTAPTDEALKRDIELSMAAGFNGARLHQKVFEPRFHYWADTLGYLTWGESSSWGVVPDSHEGAKNFLREWRAIIERDRNHPSIITWTPWNETWNVEHERVFSHLHVQTYDLTKALDPTRPAHTSSGGSHVKTDIWTLHDYEQNPDALRATLAAGKNSHIDRTSLRLPAAQPHAGQPVIMDEFGGIKWIADEDRVAASDSWGYGNAPQTLEAFYERLEGLVDVLLERPEIQGYCYTQLTDVEQEQNGVYYYDRSEKFDMTRVTAAFSKTP